MTEEKLRVLENKLKTLVKNKGMVLTKRTAGTFEIDGKPVEVNCGEIINSFFENMPEEQQNKLINWIKKFMVPIKSPNYSYSSYALKHFAEHDLGFYIGNNQFKEATLKAGLIPVRYNDLNWYYRISQKPLRTKQGL